MPTPTDQQQIAELHAEIERQRELMQNLLLHIGEPAACRGCRAAIVWVEHKTLKADGSRKRVPYDWNGLNHFANCPERDRFRKPA